MGHYERLSAMDASFIHLEDSNDHTPMHVGSVATFEGAPFFGADGRFRLDEAKELIGSRLHLVPRFRKKLMKVPFGQGRPVWVDDPHFDLDYHVRLTALPRPGDEARLKALMGRIQAQMLDRRRPLWELWFVEGLEGDRVGLIQKTHHALVDGISGVDVAMVLLDFEPEPVREPAPPWQREAPPLPAELLVESLGQQMTQPAEAARRVRATFRGGREALDQVGRAVASGVTSAPRTFLNVKIGPHRRFETATVSLDDVKAVRKSLGGTINDVVLTIVGGGIRHYFEHRGEATPEDLELRTMCPVSVRLDEERGALGNRVSAMFAALPVGLRDPAQRLERIKEQLAHLKTSGQAVGAERLVELTEFAPTTLMSLGARLIGRQRSMNLVITNVPGPQVPLYCLGSRMLSAFPYVGITDNMALVVGVLSYDGTLGFGLTGDADALPDLHVLAEGIEKASAELLERC